MDIPGSPEVPGPERRVVDINEFRFDDLTDDHFASIQLSEWAHPKVPKETLVETIRQAVNPTDDSPWAQHLAQLLSDAQYINVPYDPTNPWFNEIVKAIALATPDQIEAIEVVRRLHIMTTSGPDPVGPSSAVPILLSQIINES